MRRRKRQANPGETSPLPSQHSSPAQSQLIAQEQEQGNQKQAQIVEQVQKRDCPCQNPGDCCFR